MAKSQRAAHAEFTKTFPHHLITKWTNQVDEWCADPFNSEVENPFEEPAPDMTMADVRHALNAEEAKDLANGTVLAHAVSPSNYLVSGLHLEDQQ